MEGTKFLTAWAMTLPCTT